MSTPADYLPALNAIYERINQIQALAENPHWTQNPEPKMLLSRRWRIAQLAQHAKREMEMVMHEIVTETKPR